MADPRPHGPGRVTDDLRHRRRPRWPRRPARPPAAAASPAAAARAAGPPTCAAHLGQHGPVPYRGRARALIGDVRAAGLTGRGGAAFPVHRKLDGGGRGPPRPAIVVGNGAEGEPASHKDESLLHSAPHLVLDGLQLAAEAVGAAARDPVRPPRRAGPHRGSTPRSPQRRARGLDRVAGRARRRAGPLPGRRGVGAGQPGQRRAGGAAVHAAAGLRARGGRSPDPGPERGDPGPPGADRPVRPGLVPRPGHRRRSRAPCSARCTRPTGR